MEQVITKEIVVKAILFGACRVPEVGSRISDNDQADLIWAERLLPIKNLVFNVPLWTLSGDGDGSGYGSGDGSGSGYGSGDGDGYGYGDGDGSGYGSGDGDGYGDGDGSGYGYGSGYGSGYGDGYGSGYGYGYSEKYKKLVKLCKP